jgi:NTP pyrophosphatase (non-canonical NTP hydrolase)
MLKRKENEILLIAQEECAEVIQAISKVFRFGMDERYEDETNRARLEEEIGDVACLIQKKVKKKKKKYLNYLWTNLKI